LATLWIDPLPFAFVVSPLRGILDLIAAVVLVVTVSAAISRTLARIGRGPRGCCSRFRSPLSGAIWRIW